MVYSMTGFGRGEGQLAGRAITVEIKSVNHRYLEYASRLPRSFSSLDDKLKKLVSAAISRGKTEITVSVQNLSGGDVTVRPDLALAAGYLSALRTVARELAVPDDVTVATLSRFGDIFVETRDPQGQEEAEAAVLTVAQEAIAAFTAMRGVEGEKLRADILSRLVTMENLVTAVEEASAPRVSAYREKLETRLRAVLADTNIDEGRILQEAAIYADKTAVDEETVRLRSHIAQYREILAAGGAMGKKLDFLTQELNREANTIGSKAGDLAITRLVVELKAEIEKIREQIQNIE